MGRERVLGEGFELDVDVFADHLRYRVFGGADSLALSLALKEETQANAFGLLLSNEQDIPMMMFSNEQYAERGLRFGADAPQPNSR